MRQRAYICTEMRGKEIARYLMYDGMRVGEMADIDIIDLIMQAASTLRWNRGPNDMIDAIQPKPPAKSYEDVKRGAQVLYDREKPGGDLWAEDEVVKNSYLSRAAKE